MSRRDEIIGKIAEVPALPASSINAIALVQSKDVELTELTKFLEHEPGPAANVLKLVNSASYNLGQPVGTIKDAVIRLGRKQVMNIILSELVGPVTKPAVRGYDLPPNDLWQHSIVVTIGAQIIAARQHSNSPDYYSVAGLLHDVGKIVLGTFVEVDAEPMIEIAKNERRPFNEVEEQVLGIDHAEAGAILLENWKFPQEIINAVRWHHKPEESPYEATRYVHVADSISLMTGIGVGVEGLQYSPSEEAVKAVNLSVEETEKVTFNMLIGLQEAKRLFGM